VAQIEPPTGTFWGKGGDLEEVKRGNMLSHCEHAFQILLFVRYFFFILKQARAF
jgi:hypothetical protein